MVIGKRLYIVKNVIKLNLYNMRKIKLKLESLKYLVPIIWKAFIFKIKIFWHKIINH
jgi:hypothetical protein